MLFNRLTTISRRLADWSDCQLCRFPWTKENSRRLQPLHSTIFGIAEEFIQATVYLYTFMALQVLCLSNVAERLKNICNKSVIG